MVKGFSQMCGKGGGEGGEVRCGKEMGYGVGGIQTMNQQKVIFLISFLCTSKKSRNIFFHPLLVSVRFYF